MLGRSSSRRRHVAATAATALVTAGLALSADAASAEVVWLCQPGVMPDPCDVGLTTTVEEPGGGSRIEEPVRTPDPAIDCFDVYPTVSEQPGVNANKDKDPEVVAVASHQAARFSQRCRVFAPVYRQLTLLSIAAGTPEQRAAGGRIAYGDVREAWLEYLERHNGGRGVVLIGHSQGTRMLRELVREEIDPQPDVRSRLVSALLLGGNVLVRRGQRTGGDFQQVPACSAPSETGCIVAYSAFNEPPPSGSRFGRSPASDTSGAGFPAGPEYEVLCNNPASLGANERTPLTTYVHGEPFPGVIGLLLVLMYGGPQPSADTPWLQPRDRYTGRCEQSDGANVLMVEPIGNARRLNPSPDPGWGLHLADVNIALGELVALVDRQAGAWAAAHDDAEPELSVRLRHRRGRDARGRSCARAPITVVLGGRDAGQVRRVDVLRGRRVLARDRGAPLRVSLGRARLRAGAVNRLRVDALLIDGRRVRLTRAVRVCS